MSFPAYPDYQDSGIAWANEMPVHWDVKQLKWLFDLQKRPVRDEDEIVTAFRDGIVTLRKHRREEGFTNSLKEIGYQGIRKGDLVIHAMDGFAGAIGVSDSDGKSTPVYSVCKPKEGSLSEYFGRLLRYMALSGFVDSLAKGVRERSTEFRWRDASVLPLPVPPMDEQRAIVHFLDRETAKIDALVAEQERLIALLKEKRQAVISHALTKGLNPDAPMKNSGIEWLGEIPAHWDAVPVKRIARVLPGYAFPAEEFSQDENDWALLRGINISPHGLRWNEDTAYWRRDDEDRLSAWELAVGDLVLGMDRPWIGDGIRAAIISDDDLPCLLLQRVASIRPHGSLPSKFLLRCFQHDAFYHYCAPDLTGVSVPHLSGGQIEDFKVALPPPDEARAISDAIDNHLNEIDTLEGQSREAIDLLRERRAALISAAVTGKIDVRGLVEQNEMEAA